MSESIFKPYRVAVLGFTDFERTSLASYFRLAGDRDPHYELVYTLTDADFMVADADHEQSVQVVTVTERLAETVFVGSADHPGAIASLRRPIDALHVMRALDAVALARRAGRSVARPAAEPQSLIAASMARPGAAARTHPAPSAPALREAAALVASEARPVVPAPPGFVGPPTPPRALLVDDSSIALRYLSSRLVPWGVRCDAVHSSTEALELVAAHAYDLIFLDLELGPGSELDGLALCRQIKRSATAVNASVVMVSAHHSEIDRARGALAGCDAYLGKPLKESELAQLLRRHGLPMPSQDEAARALESSAARASTRSGSRRA